MKLKKMTAMTFAAIALFGCQPTSDGNGDSSSADGNAVNNNTENGETPVNNSIDNEAPETSPYSITFNVNNQTINEGSSLSASVFIMENTIFRVPVSEIDYTISNTNPSVLGVSVTENSDSLSIELNAANVDEDTDVTLSAEIQLEGGTVTIIDSIVMTVLNAAVPASVGHAQQLVGKTQAYHQLPEVVKIHNLFLDLAYLNGDIKKSDVFAAQSEMSDLIEAKSQDETIFYNDITTYADEGILDSVSTSLHASEVLRLANTALAQADDALVLLNNTITNTGQSGRLPAFPLELVQTYEQMLVADSIFEGDTSMGEYADGDWTFTGEYAFMNDIMGVDVQ